MPIPPPPPGPPDPFGPPPEGSPPPGPYGPPPAAYPPPAGAYPPGTSPHAPIAAQPTGPVISLAGWGTRWAAVSIDWLIRSILSVLVALGGFALFSDDPFSDRTEWSSDLSNIEGLLLTAFFIYLLVMPFYSAIFLAAWQGQTPGKRAAGVRVVLEETGRPPGFGRAVLREVVGKTVLISWIGAFAGGFAWLLSYLWPLWDPQCRAGHDFIARTRVVRS